MSETLPVTVLNVNDTEATRYTITRMLRRAGFVVSEAATGAEALERMKDVPDVVVLDVKLPDTSGYEVCRRIKSDPATATVQVLLTSAAFVRTEDRVHGLDGGADGYLVQPAEPIELVATVRSLVRMRRAEEDRMRMLERERAARQETERTLDRLVRLQVITTRLSEAVTVAQVAETTATLAVPALGASAAVFLLRTRDGNALELCHATGYDPDEVRKWKHIELALDVPLTEAVRTGAMVYVASRAAWVQRYGALGAGVPEERGARVAVPLVVHGKAIGAVGVSFHEERALGADEQLFLQAMASVCAQSVERARQYDAAQTARTEAERERARAEDANRVKDEFLATVSHELRTPLTAILGWSRMLRGGHVAEGKKTNALEAIERNARAQAQIIEDILEVSRIVSGKLRVELAPVDLATVVQDAVDVVRPTAETRGVTLATETTGVPAIVSGDADRLQQVVWNLVTNAVKFTHHGGRVQVALERDERELRIVVTDDGRGIEADFLPHVFDRFRQADSTSTRSYGGLGLGLAIVRHLVELHGGTVRAMSAGPGLGSTFTVALPRNHNAIALPRNGAPRAELPVRETLPPHPVLEGVHVLVVDDEADTRELLVAVLAHQGARVTAVGTVREALSALEAHGADLLLSDLGMPDQDGYALIREVRARDGASGAIPAVAVTAYARADDARMALAAGFQQHVAKPIDPATLVRTVKAIVRPHVT